MFLSFPPYSCALSLSFSLFADVSPAVSLFYFLKIGLFSKLHTIQEKWSEEEHKRFVEAIERSSESTSLGSNLWAHIARGVGTRSEKETIVYAQAYFRELQRDVMHDADSLSFPTVPNVRRTRKKGFALAEDLSKEPEFAEESLSVDDKDVWSYEEDQMFENALGNLIQSQPDLAPEMRWQMISRAVPGKTPADIEKRYETLVEDIRSIERGTNVCTTYRTSDSGKAKKLSSKSEWTAKSKVGDPNVSPSRGQLLTTAEPGGVGDEKDVPKGDPMDDDDDGI